MVCFILRQAFSEIQGRQKSEEMSFEVNSPVWSRVNDNEKYDPRDDSSTAVQ